MQTQARKRTRVADYNYNDEVAERSTKRIKQESKIKQEIKTIEAETKQESMAPIKNESKMFVKSEIKSEVKIELKKEKIEKKVKLEPKVEIKRENGHTEEATDQAEENFDEDVDLNEEPSRSNEQTEEKGPDAIEISDDEEEEEENEGDEEDDDEGEENTALRIGDCPDKYNFAEFKTIILAEDRPRWLNPTDQPQALINTKVIETILSFSSLPDVLIWMRVSKSTSNLAYNQSLWQILFGKQHWRLPHEIRNHNFRPVIQLDISDRQVDWYKEYKRNYSMRCEVRKVIDTIVRVDNGEPNKKFRIGDEVINAWEKKTDYFLPNELREFYKYAPDAYSIPEIDDLYICTDEVSLFSLYRVKVDEEDDDDEEGEPDVSSIAKLLDIPKSRVDRDFAGILYIVNHGRQGDFVFVPYVNRFYLICSTNSGEGVYFCQERTLVRRLEEFRERFIARRK